MPDLPLLHANERVDRVDLSAVIGFPRDLDNLLTKYRFIDRQSRILRGFRIELPDQNQFPGRVIVHGGFGHQYDGQHVFNEDQLNVSRTVTLEGSSTTFYLEVEFLESESDVDARAFWDATVDQGFDISGDALPDGQEFSANVATRKTPDWQIVTPISTTGFTRDQVASLSSNRIPLAILATDSANKVSGTGTNNKLATEKAVSTLMRYISTTQIIVKEPWLFQTGDTINVTDGSGSSASSVTSVSQETGLLTIAAITAKAPGAIVRVTSAASPDFITEAAYGRYGKISAGGSPPNHFIDWRDMMWQGDEVHGEILSHGHSAVTDRSDVNLQSLKDHVDMLAAQLQELKWGIMDPSVSMLDASRVPPGIATSFPTIPRYYDRAGGVAGARMFTVTVGDGTSSFGDFNGTTEAVLQAAHDSLPSTGGRIFVKRGTYNLSADFDLINTGVVRIEAEEGVIFEVDGGAFHVASTGSFFFKNLTFSYVSSLTGMLIDTSNPLELDFERVVFLDCSLDIDCQMPNESSFRQCRFWAALGTSSARPLIRTLGNGGARISGTFFDCNINHVTAVFIAAGLIYCNPADDGLFFVNFVDCSFGQALLNGEMINCGTSPNIVQFDRCYFSSLLTPVHIRVIGGTNIKSYNCVGTDPFAGHIHGTDATHILVDGYRNGNSTGFAFVDLADCSDVVIQNCDVTSNSGTALTGASVKLQATVGNTVRGLTVRDNKFQSDTGVGLKSTTAVIILTDGEEIHDITIERNEMRDYQCAVYINSLGIGGEIFNTKINDNRITGQTVSGGTADPKIGIYIPGDDSTLRIWGINVLNNMIQDLNSSAGYIVGSVPRCGIYVTGAWEPNIAGNRIRNLTSNLNVSGIVTSGWNGIVNNNIIDTISGSGVALFEGSVIGIRVGGAIDPENWTINGNTLEEIRTSGAQPTYQYGIQLLGDATCVTINGNTIHNLYNTGGGAPTQGNAFLGIPVTPASAYIRDVTISNNTCSMDNISAGSSLICTAALVEIAATEVRNLNILGNSVRHGTDTGNGGRGIRVTVGASSAFGININDNIINGHPTAEAIKCSCSALGYGLSICQNKIYANSLGTLAGTQILVTDVWSDATIGDNTVNGVTIGGNTKFNIQITNATFFTCTGNTCRLPGSTTVPNIEVDGGGTAAGNGCLIANNVCMTAGGTATVASIRTTNALGGLGGIIEANIVDFAVAVRGADTAVDNKTL